MPRITACIVCLGLVACTVTTWTSRVTLQPPCSPGAPFPALTHEVREGRCAEQVDTSGFRIVGCSESSENQTSSVRVAIFAGIPIALVVAATVTYIAVASGDVSLIGTH